MTTIRFDVVPYHFHECPGVKQPGRSLQKDHVPHDYPCHNPRCSMGDKRYCGIVVDAALLKRGMMKLLDQCYV